MQPLISSTPCPEREKIMERYRAAIKTYRVTTASLEGVFGAEFERAYRHSEQARETFELVRKELKEHLGQHQCFDPSNDS